MPSSSGPRSTRCEAHHRNRFTLSHHLDVDHGLVGPDAVRGFVHGSSNAHYFVCGPAPFMDVIESTLLTDGIDADRIHIERFTPAQRLAEEEPADDPSGDLRVSIELDGRTEATDYRPGTTILQTARQLGMSPPFSCESGSCATCMAKLVEGTASMQGQQRPDRR